MMGNPFADGGGGNGGAYGGAMNTIKQFSQQGQNVLQPYEQSGQNAVGGISALENQFSNPEEAFNNFAQSYQMSPGAQFKLHHGLTAVRNAMAQRGLSGSGPESEALTNYSQGVINEDMNHQWQNVLNGGRLGLGAGSELYRGGLTAVGDASHLYGQEGANIAGLQEAQERQKEQEQQQNRNDIWSAAGAIGGALL